MSETPTPSSTRDYGGQIESCENGGEPIPPTGDALLCADCGRPAYYDRADEQYHHALDAAQGCFLIDGENRVDDFDHPLLQTDTDRDAAWGAWCELERRRGFDPDADPNAGERRPIGGGRVVAMPEPDGDLLYTAWTIIANAYGGDWDTAPPEWKQAAERWRDQWHAQP